MRLLRLPSASFALCSLAFIISIARVLYPTKSHHQTTTLFFSLLVLLDCGGAFLGEQNKIAIHQKLDANADPLVHARPNSLRRLLHRLQLQHLHRLQLRFSSGAAITLAKSRPIHFVP
ncbi:hypothetical protein PS1_003487 [Malus domestica]